MLGNNLDANATAQSAAQVASALLLTMRSIKAEHPDVDATQLLAIAKEVAMPKTTFKPLVVYTPQEAAKILDCGTKTVLRLIRAGLLKAGGSGEDYRILHDNLVEFLSSDLTEDERYDKLVQKTGRTAYEEFEDVTEDQPPHYRMGRSYTQGHPNYATQTLGVRNGATNTQSTTH